MKKIIACVGIVIALVLAFAAGFSGGKMHTLEAGVFYIVDYDEVVFDGNEFDTTLYIELDGNVYMQGLYIG